MEFNQYISPDGETYDFDNQEDMFMESMSGSGMPKINPVVYDISQYHGKYRAGYRLEPRSIKLIHSTITGQNREKFYQSRNRILNILRPNRSLNDTPGILRKIFNDGTMRDLDVYISGGLSLDEGKAISISHWIYKDVVEFIAYNPIYYDPEYVVERLTIQGINELVFPITFPITFGGNIVEAETTLHYDGTWETWPVIEITGPVTSPTIYNETSGKIITLNYKVADGEVITIDTDPFNMSVVNDSGDSLIGHCGNSDLTTFSLLTAPYEDNTIRFWGGAKYTAATCDIIYKTRYIGY